MDMSARIEDLGEKVYSFSPSEKTEKLLMDMSARIDELGLKVEEVASRLLVTPTPPSLPPNETRRRTTWRSRGVPSVVGVEKSAALMRRKK